MQHDRRRFIVAAWAAELAALTAALPAWASEPDVGAGRKRIEIVVPFPPDGTADLFARVIGRGLQEKTALPVCKLTCAKGFTEKINNKLTEMAIFLIDNIMIKFQ